MFEPLRKQLSFTLAWFITMVSTAPAQQPDHAPVPKQVLTAHTVFISNEGGSNYFEIFKGGPDRAYNTFYAYLQRANRYQLVDSPAQADVIFAIRGIAPTISQNDVATYNPQLILSIVDPKTRAVLWTTSANVRAIGTQRRRDKGFDQSVSVLVAKLGEVTGQPLSPEETKAIRDNSRMPTAEKIFIIVSIAAVAGFAAWGAYRISHPPAPPSLPAPTFP